MPPRRMIGLVVGVAVAAIAIFLFWQATRISLDVPLARSASQILYHKFGSQSSQRADVYVLDTNAGTVTQMTTNYRVSRATWSEDGESLVLAVGDKGRSELLANGQTRGLPDSQGYTPQYSPDKTYFTYDDCSIDFNSYGWLKESSIFIVEAANPANTLEVTNACFSSWSPQGDQLVFTSQESEDADPELYLINRDGSNRRRLVANAGADIWAEWSPTGTHLAFRTMLRTETASGQKVFVVDADGQNLVQVDDFSWNLNNAFEWSPDGQTLLYANGSEKLCFVKAGAAKPDCSQVSVSDAVWSPDGTRVVYKEIDETLCVMDPLAILMLERQCFPGTEEALFLDWRPA